VADAALAERIEAIWERSRRSYGAPRIHAMLAREGIRVGRKRVERLMRPLRSILSRESDLPGTREYQRTLKRADVEYNENDHLRQAPQPDARLWDATARSFT
jgi:hypothetical protein